ncbi:MAG: SsrA-binding protein [Luteibaculaceae bacterium]|jgi:SsrA-binding protein
MGSPIKIKNKKASFEYEFLETFTAGIQLQGTEIKSIRNNKASIVEGYCFLRKGEMFIKNMFIAQYAQGTYNNHEPRRERKLLLQKSELKKLDRKMKDKGLTIIPTLLFINDAGYAKLNIALAKGKKMYDKRESLKDKDNKRSLDRIKKLG